MRYVIAKSLGVLLLIVMGGVPVFGYQRKAVPDAASERKRKPGDEAKGKPKEGKEDKNAYSYNLPGPDGKDVPLSSFKGKVILVVNLARNSSYNDQLPALTKLSEKYRDKGLVVIGIPSNDFGAAEPGTDAEIQKVYKTDAKVPFPVMARSLLTGDEAIPLYGYLTKGKGAPPGGNVHWNYTKFLIDKSGKVIARLEPDVAPDSPEMLSTLDQIFSGTYKGKPKEEQTEPPSGDAQI